MCWPGHLAPAVSDRPVELVDVMPTLLAAASVPDAAPPRGRALLGKRPAWRSLLGGGSWGVLPDPGAFEGWAEECCFAVDASGLREAKRAPQRAVIALPYKLIASPHAVELFDLDTDAAERRNLADTRAEERKRLASRLRDRLAELGEVPEGPDADRLEMLRSLGYVR
jgi:arylsulfatase A-like enzyme